MRQIIEQTKPNPVLADRAIASINQVLLDKLWWLDQAFGRAYKVTRVKHNKKYTEPCVYSVGRGNSYETLVPSADLGNYSFFVLRDPTQIEDMQSVTIPYSMILFVDMRKCFSSADKNRRDTENIKDEVIRVLRKDVWLRDGVVSVTRVYEEAKNVFQGFTLEETENQYNMQPYAVFRFDGEIKVASDCQ